MMSDNKTQTRLCGLVAAAFTPFNEDKSLNLEVIDKYVEHLYNNQVMDVFICGTTGEGMSMTVDERKQVAEKWVQAGKDKLDKIIVQVGAHNLIESQQLAAHAQAIGASCIAALPSLFFKPNTIEGLVEYCRQIAACAPDLPFYYYHFPHFTDVRLDMQQFFLQAGKAIPTLAGMKFQSSHLGDAMMVNTMHKGVFQVMMACDEVYLGALAMGIDWAIGSTYSLLPNVVQRMIDSFNRGDIQAARQEQLRIQELVNLRNKYSVDITVFKEMMSMCGLFLGPPRLPLQPLSDEQRKSLREDLQNIGFFTWGKDTLTPPDSPLKYQSNKRLNRRPLDRTTSLLTHDEPSPNSPKGFQHRVSSGGDMTRLGSSSSDQDVYPARQTSLEKQSSVSSTKQYHPIEKRQSSTALLTE